MNKLFVEWISRESCRELRPEPIISGSSRKASVPQKDPCPRTVADPNRGETIAHIGNVNSEICGKKFVFQTRRNGATCVSAKPEFRNANDESIFESPNPKPTYERVNFAQRRSATPSIIAALYLSSRMAAIHCSGIA